MRVISDWAHIDGDITSILSTMLKSDIRIGTAMFQALSGGEARKAALLAAAKEALPPWQYIMIQAVQKATKASRDQRHIFAHHAWAICPQLPDNILILPPDVVTEFNISHRQTQLVGTVTVIRPTGLDHSRIMVYSHADFDRATEASAYARVLYGYLYLTIYGASEIGRRWLLLQPPIVQALQKLTIGSDPSVVQQLKPPVGDELPPESTRPV